MIFELALSLGFVIIVFLFMTLLLKMWNDEDPR